MLKNLVFGLLKMITTVVVVLGILYILLTTGVAEAILYEVSDHVSVETHFDGIEFNEMGIEPVYSKSIVIR